MATTRGRLLRALAASLVLALVCGPIPVAAAADTVAFVIDDQRIAESSGLARDTVSDLYWTVNDSGAEGTVYGLTAKGAVQGIIGYRVPPVDVEAVAYHDGRLYVGDIGDNASRREFVSVYFFDNPRADNQTVPYRSYDFSYPDGPHDAETLLVDDDGHLFIVTKGLRAGVYAAPDQPSRQGVNTLRRVADAPAYVTDGTFLPDGGGIALRTYVSVQLLDAETYQVTAREAVPLQRQGESLTLSLDGESLLVGSEGRRSAVLQIPVPTAMGEAPSAASTPPSTSTPTATATPSPEEEAEPDVDPQSTRPDSRTGSLVALSLAALVALIAGIVVAARRS